MSGETEKQVSGWTVDTLHALVLQMLHDRDSLANERAAAAQVALKTAIDAQDKQTQQALTAADRAVVKAELATEKRFESVNEFRKALSDQTSNFMSRTEVLSELAGLAEKIEAHSNRLGSVMTRTEVDSLFTSQSATSAARYQQILDQAAITATRLDKAEGTQGGLKLGAGFIVGAVGLTATIITVIYVILKGTGH